jgi:hypothetical protein
MLALTTNNSTFTLTLKKTDYNCKIVVQKMELTTMKKANNTTNFKTYTKAFVTEYCETTL